MAAPRIWKAAINIDLLNAVNAGLLSDADRAAAWSGLILGLSGAELPSEVASKPLRGAFEAGSAAFLDAHTAKEAQVNGGRNSALARKTIHGTAQPQKPAPEVASEVASEVAPEAPFEVILNPESIKIKEYPPTPLGGDAVAVKPITKSAPGSWRDYFAGKPEALAEFDKVVAARAAKAAKLKARPSAPPEGVADPGVAKGARNFLALVNGGNDPRLLRACFHLYLKDSANVEKGYLKGLPVFFGLPGKGKDLTWMDYLGAAEAFLAGLQATPPPSQPPASASGAFTVSADLLAASGVPLPMPMG